MDYYTLGLYIGFYLRLIFVSFILFVSMKRALNNKNNIWAILIILDALSIYIYYNVVYDIWVMIIPVLYLMFNKDNTSNLNR